jgi:hypothetical protein
MAPDLITITTHTRRDEAGRLVYLSIEGIPADWSDYTFKNEVFYDESTGGTLAPIAPLMREAGGMVDLARSASAGHASERVYLDD